MTRDLANLHQRARRGDKDAGLELERIAHETGDVAALLSSWRALYPTRFNAWQAFKAAIRTGKDRSNRQKTAQETQLVQTEITAQVLLETCEIRLQSDPDAMAQALLDLAKAILTDERVRLTLAREERVTQLLDAVQEALLQGAESVRACMP